MTANGIEEVLASFRGWLTALLEPPAAPLEPAIEFDLHSLVSQFTALRHDVNLQTRATRIATEQSAETVRQLAQAPKRDPNELIKPLLTSLIEIHDAISLAHRQVSKSVAAAEPLLESLSSPSMTPPPESMIAPKRGFIGRWFAGNTNEAWEEWATTALEADLERATEAETAYTHFSSLIAGVADGYAMSLRRIERILPTYDLEPIPTIGLVFDAETMEVVEAVSDSDKMSNTVAEEVRRGYRWRGSIFRFAQVKVVR